MTSGKRVDPAQATPWPALLCLLYFCLVGILVLPYPGVENDEALFANGVYAPELMPGRVDVLGRTVPTMVMPYVGALKSWLYSLIFGLVPATRWTLRVPMLLAGAASIWFFYRFLYRTAGRTPAIIGCVLLSTDVTYLLTVTFDRGPVAPQQFLIAGGLLLAARFYQEREDPSLAGAFFLFGLALWDKAVFLWTFSGIAIAGGVIFRREVFSGLTLRRGAIATAAFLAGSLPFWVYNLSSGFATFGGTSRSTKDLDIKVAVMQASLRGTVLSRYMIDYDSPAARQINVNSLEAAALSISDLAGHERNSLLPYALWLAVALLPLAWRRSGWRAPLFFAAGFATTWAQMLFTDRAGGSSHHTVLVWFHVMGFISVALALGTRRLPKLGRKAVAIPVAVVVVSNVLLLNEYFAGLVRFGPGRFWSDAIYPLCDYLKSVKPEVVYAADWGMDYSTRLFLGRGIPVAEAINLFPQPELNDVERSRMQKRMSQPTAVFVSYVDGKEVFPKGKRLIQQYADENGYDKKLLREISDSRNRPVFEVYRFEKHPEGSVAGVLRLETEASP